MKGTPLRDLPPARQADVLAALAAVETADAPVPRTAFRALADGTLRTTLETSSPRPDGYCSRSVTHSCPATTTGSPSGSPSRVSGSCRRMTAPC